MKRTKIIATLGPASFDRKTIKQLVKNGVDVFRLNFSFGSEKEHAQTIKCIREISLELNQSVGILQDLQGPKIRVATLKEPVTVKKNQVIILSGNAAHKESLYIPTTYRQIAGDTEPGKTILLADGKIILSVLKTDISKKEVTCKVVNGGTILTGKGINLPYTNISLPALTPKDKKDAIFGIKKGVDYIGLSFVRHPEDVLKLKRIMKKMNKEIPVIAKIEKPEGVDNIEEILDVADGIMVARGDLAVEISFAKVPLVQKDLLRRANLRGKLTIVATEMLSSMSENPRPTRAEASDVANAVLDGTDAVMLSNETAMGKFPTQSVAAMNSIVTETETSLLNQNYHMTLDMPEIQDLTQAMCESAAHLSYFLDERAIAVITHSGGSVKVISKYRPQSPIYAATFDINVYHKMALYHNVHPLLLDDSGLSKKNDNLSYSLEQFESLLRNKKLVKTGDSLIFLTGDILPKGWRVNTIKVSAIR